MNYWDGSSWVAVAPGSSGQTLTFCEGVPAWGPCLEVGAFRKGGVIFYIFQSGDPGYVDGEIHGLVCAVEDQDGGSGIVTWNGSYTITGATGTAIGTGQANTNTIISSQGIGSYAASVCNDYSVTVNGIIYNDWFLPSKDELNLMYQNRGNINTTAVSNGGSALFVAFDSFYWSSSEFGELDTWLQNFNSGIQFGSLKNNVYRVRAIRTF